MANAFQNYCKTYPPPKSCRKNLGIERKNMPQISTYSLLAEFIEICLSNRYDVTHDVILYKLDDLDIYTSQKEVNKTKAKKMVPKNHYPIPVIMLKKGSVYMIVDGHHRWLAHKLHKKPLNILEIKIPSSQTLANAFYTLDNNMKRSGLNFHPKLAISGEKKYKTCKLKMEKTPRPKIRKISRRKNRKTD